MNSRKVLEVEKAFTQGKYHTVQPRANITPYNQDPELRTSHVSASVNQAAVQLLELGYVETNLVTELCHSA